VNTRLPCGMYAIPDRSKSRGLADFKGIPSKLTRPFHTGSKPKIAFSNVDFPAPLWPMRAVISPVGAAMSTPFRICFLPYPVTSSLTASIARTSSAKIRLHDFGTFQNVMGWPLGDHLAVVHDDHQVSHLPHRFHVVLDEHDQLALIAQLP
jgi:hypothetical protein